VLVDLAANFVYLAHQCFDAFGSAQRLLVKSQACEMRFAVQASKLAPPRRPAHPTLVILLRPPPPFARAPQIFPPTRHRCASACRPIPEWTAARARLLRGYLETSIGPASRQVHRSLTLSPGCLQSALQYGGQPLRKPLRAQNLQPVGHAAPGGQLNPWETNTSFPRDLAGATATWRGILDAQPRRRLQMKGIPSCERQMPWR
jgi:hypothetical protein